MNSLEWEEKGTGIESQRKSSCDEWRRRKVVLLNPVLSGKKTFRTLINVSEYWRRLSGITFQSAVSPKVFVMTTSRAQYTISSSSQLTKATTENNLTGIMLGVLLVLLGTTLCRWSIFFSCQRSIRVEKVSQLLLDLMSTCVCYFVMLS